MYQKTLQGIVVGWALFTVVVFVFSVVISVEKTQGVEAAEASQNTTLTGLFQPQGIVAVVLMSLAVIIAFLITRAMFHHLWQRAKPVYEAKDWAEYQLVAAQNRLGYEWQRQQDLIKEIEHLQQFPFPRSRRFFG